MPLLFEWLKRTVEDGGKGAATALVYRDTYLSWRGLAHRVDRRAQELTSYGIGPGSWVGLMLGNVPDFVVLALAVSKVGGVLCPIDPTTGARDLDMILEATPLRALITRPRGNDSSPSLPAVTTARGSGRPYQPRFTPESRRRLQGTLLNCSVFRRDGKAFEAGYAPEVTLFTTDVGGDPKGVLRAAPELDAVASSIGRTLGLGDGQDKILALAPLHHAYGFDFGFCAAMAHGSTLFLDDEVDGRTIAKTLREQSIDVFPGTPAIYAALARVVTARPLEPARPRFLSSGSPLPPGLAEAIAARFKVPVMSCYHTTETGPVSLDRSGGAPATVGSAFDGVEVRVGNEGARGHEDEEQAGPVWVRTRAISRLLVPEVTVAQKGPGAPIGQSDPDGWFRTGDRGRLGDGGALTLEGREDDLVKVEGKRVALGEIESCLEGFGKVREAEARVVADETGGATIVARVVTAAGCKAEELIDHCARHLAPYKVPRQIELCERLG